MGTEKVKVVAGVSPQVRDEFKAKCEKLNRNQGEVLGVLIGSFISGDIQLGDAKSEKGWSHKKRGIGSGRAAGSLMGTYKTEKEKKAEAEAEAKKEKDADGEK